MTQNTVHQDDYFCYWTKWDLVIGLAIALGWLYKFWQHPSLPGAMLFFYYGGVLLGCRLGLSVFLRHWAEYNSFQKFFASLAIALAGFSAFYIEDVILPIATGGRALTVMKNSKFSMIMSFIRQEPALVLSCIVLSILMYVLFQSMRKPQTVTT